MSYTLTYKIPRPNLSMPSMYIKHWWVNYLRTTKSFHHRKEDLSNIGCKWNVRDGTLTFETEEDALAFILKWA
jgi:hypothetical protein